MLYTSVTGNCTFDSSAGRKVIVMESIRIPTYPEIAAMSLVLCELERTRLRNEISFAQGNALWSGPSAGNIIDSCNETIRAINSRLSELTDLDPDIGAPSQEWESSWENSMLL